MLRVLMVCLGGLLCLAGAQAAETISYRSGDLVLSGYLCLPAGPGPFAAVVYNHGGLGDRIGGAPRETCEALAAAGYVGFSPLRRATRSLDGHGDDIRAAVARLHQLAGVDASRIAMIGFSRGALLTYQAAIETASLKAAVLMATAVPPRQFARSLAKPADIAVPLLLLVAENDTGSRATKGRDTLAATRDMHRALVEAGKDVSLIVYPPHGDDGHALFFSLGAYMSDVLVFLNRHL
jgi:dienelactone hydrolase